MAKKLYADGNTGDIAIYDPVNGDTPFTNPISNLSHLFFHSSLDYMAVDHVWEGTISHPARDRSGSTDKYIQGNYRPLSGTQDFVLSTHSLGVIPSGVLVIGNDMQPAMSPIHVSGGSRRFVSLVLTSTQCILRERWFTFNNSLGAVNRTYKVFLFSGPISPSGNKTLEIGAQTFRASRGKLDIANRYIRAVSSDPQFYLGLGATADVRGGGLRVVTPAGATTNDGVYNGSFAGPSAKGCSV